MALQDNDKVGREVLWYNRKSHILSMYLDWCLSGKLTHYSSPGATTEPGKASSHPSNSCIWIKFHLLSNLVISGLVSKLVDLWVYCWFLIWRTPERSKNTCKYNVAQVSPWWGFDHRSGEDSVKLLGSLNLIKCLQTGCPFVDSNHFTVSHSDLTIKTTVGWKATNSSQYAKSGTSPKKWCSLPNEGLDFNGGPCWLSKRSRGVI